MNWMLTIAATLWMTLEAMAPYLLFGFAVAGILSVLISPATVEKHLGGRGFGSVVRAALIGVPLPLCSCSVIPVTLTLRRHGAGRGAATAFLLSTPQTGVDSIAVTYALLGPVIAVFRPLAAFLTGVLGGLATNILTPDDPEPPSGKPAEPCKPCCGNAKRKPNTLWRALHHGFVTLPSDAGASMLAGLLIAGAIAGFVPDAFFSEVLGGGILGMLAMMLFGIPVYVCATASVPIAAALIAKGVSPGVALVFLMTGPATNAAGIAAVWKMMGRRTAILYLATTAISALAAGIIFDMVIRYLPALDVQPPCHDMHTRSWPSALAAGILLLVLIAPTLLKWYRHWHPAPIIPEH